jgi:hypothetical protein
MAQVVQCLLSKCEALSSNPGATKKEKITVFSPSLFFLSLFLPSSLLSSSFMLLRFSSLILYSYELGIFLGILVPGGQ